MPPFFLSTTEYTEIKEFFRDFPCHSVVQLLPSALSRLHGCMKVLQPCRGIFPLCYKLSNAPAKSSPMMRAASSMSLRVEVRQARLNQGRGFRGSPRWCSRRY